jgi:hypothetical protein
MSSKPLFRGEVVYVWPAGFTPNEAKQLEETMVAQGAELWNPKDHRLDADALLVKDASVLDGERVHDWLKRLDTAIVLKVEWVTESIRLGCKLNGADYKVAYTRR